MAGLVGTLAHQLSNILPAPAPVPGTYSGLVAAVGGTRAAADILGVSQRTVQRQVAYDRASRGEPHAGQTRAPSPQAENTLAKEVADAASAKAKAEGIQAIRDAGGLRVSFSGEIKVSDDFEQRTFDYDVDTDALDEEWQDEDGETRESFYDALAHGSRADIAAAFNHALFADNGFPEGTAILDVDELVISLL